MTGKKYVGVDLGTSSLKMILLDETGKKIRQVTRKYPIEYPKEGWSQQNPEDWYSAFVDGMKELSDGVEKEIKGIGVGGQMHGLVILDKDDNVIRPAILWNDGRTEAEVKYLNEEIGMKTLTCETANIAFAGFTAPKILWIKKNEPENFAKISKIMLPKDYLVYKITGSFVTDMSDASGMLLLDVKNRKWSTKMCNICGISISLLPELHESSDIVGKIKDKTLLTMGLSDVIVVAGAGDNAAAAIGTGTTKSGDTNISLGTSGTVFIASDKFCVDDKNALHSFDHANGKYHLMGCMLSAASCIDWWFKVGNGENYQLEFSDVYKFAGKNNVYFLPYLMGERSPLNDVNARGAFLGLSASTTREQMNLAVIEGVSFALKQSLDVAISQGIEIKSVKCCGGGSKIQNWPQILADILDVNVEIPELEEGPSLGGAILSMVAEKVFKDVDEAAEKMVKIKKVYTPNKEISGFYKEKYEIFKQFYPNLKNIRVTKE